LSPSSTEKLSDYKLIIVPALYAASDAEIQRLNDYAKSGGHVVYTFKSGFSDENTKVRYADQPGGIAQAAGVRYNEFTLPDGVTLDGDPFKVGVQDNKVRWWMEFLTPTTATVIAKYKHPSWPDYAAMTRNTWGKGEVDYIGFMPTDAMAEKIVADEVQRAGVVSAVAGVRFPIIVRSGVLRNGHQVHYVMNYSAKAQSIPSPFRSGTELLSGKAVANGASVDLEPWGVKIIEEQAP
jgi:beta-galactosidase